MRSLLTLAALLLLTGTAMGQSGYYQGYDSNGNYHWGTYYGNQTGGGSYYGYDHGGRYRYGNYYSAPTYRYTAPTYRYNYRSTNSLYGW